MPCLFRNLAVLIYYLLYVSSSGSRCFMIILLYIDDNKFDTTKLNLKLYQFTVLSGDFILLPLLEK